MNILIAGAGKIGSLIACLLTEVKEYKVFIADLQFNDATISRIKSAVQNLTTVELDVQNKNDLAQVVQKNNINAVISCLPYFCNLNVAQIAREFNLHYFDLTEDVAITNQIKNLAKDAKTAFVPQCGLAPGFVGIVANNTIKHFDSVEIVKLRVGALPINTSNALHYSLTWSTDGLINEYGNSCHAIENGKDVLLPPLEGLEIIKLDGVNYEAFNTSGGLGSLAEIYSKKIHTMNYKTIRYPGHCEKMKLLMNDLRLNSDRNTLKRILENAIPKTYQDVVVIYVSVAGRKQNELIEENYVKKIYQHTIAGMQWSAIQVTTAAGLCAVADLVLTQPQKYRGFVFQEQFTLDEVLANRFGAYYR